MKEMESTPNRRFVFTFGEQLRLVTETEESQLDDIHQAAVAARRELRRSRKLGKRTK